MDEQTMQRILTAHADALNQGVDNTNWLLKQFHHEDQQRHEELKTLLTLARALKRVLVPVQVSKRFVVALQEELLAEDSPAAGEQPKSLNRPWVWWGAAAAGSVAAGIAGFIVWRRSRPDDQVIPTV